MKIIHVVSMQMEKANLNLSNPNELDAMKLLQNAQNCYNTSKKKRLLSLLSLKYL